MYKSKLQYLHVCVDCIFPVVCYFRDIANWSDKMKVPYIDEYGEERFQELWREWVAAMKRYYTHRNGKHQ